MTGKPQSLKQYLLDTPKAFQNKQIHAVSKNISVIGDISKEFLKATHVYLSYNMIDDTTALIQFQNCTTLSLGSNNINSLHDIDNLELMTALKHLRLDQNPIAYFPIYRMYTINTLPSLLSLDGERVSEKERIECAQVIKQEREQFQIICNLVSEYLLLQQQMQLNNDHMSILNPYNSNEQFVYQEIIDISHQVGRNKSWREVYQIIYNKYKQKYEKLQRGEENYDESYTTSSSKFQQYNNLLHPKQINKTQVLQSNGQLMSKSRAEILQKSAMQDQSRLQQQVTIQNKPQFTDQFPQQPFQMLPQQYTPYTYPQQQPFPITSAITPLQVQEQGIQQPQVIPYQQNINIVPQNQPITSLNIEPSQISIPQNVKQQEMKINDLVSQNQPQQVVQQATPNITDEQINKHINEKIEKLEQQINEQRVISANQAQELEKANQLNKQLQEQIKLLQSQNESLETQILGQTKRDADQNQQICQLQIQNQELNEKTQNYEQLTKTHAEVQSKYDTLKESNAKLKKEIEQLKVQLQDYALIKEERTQYQNKTKQLKEQKQNLDKQINDCQAQISKQNVRIQYQEEQIVIKQQQIQKEIDQKLKIQSEAIVLAKQLTKVRSVEKGKQKLEKIQMQKIFQSFIKGIKLQKYDQYVEKSIQIKISSKLILQTYKNLKIIYQLTKISQNINTMRKQQLLQQIFKTWKSKAAVAITDAISDQSSYQQFKTIDKRYNGKLMKRFFKQIKVIAGKSKALQKQLENYQERKHKLIKQKIFDFWNQRCVNITENEKIIYIKYKNLTNKNNFLQLHSFYANIKSKKVQLDKSKSAEAILKAFKQLQLIYWLSNIKNKISSCQEKQWLELPFKKYQELKQQEQITQKCQLLKLDAYNIQKRVVKFMHEKIQKQLKCTKVTNILNMNIQEKHLSTNTFSMRSAFAILKLRYTERQYKQLKDEFEKTKLDELKEQLQNITENKCIITEELKAVLESKQEMSKKYGILKQELVKQLHKNKELRKKVEHLETIGQQIISPKFNDREHELEILVNQYQLQNQALLVKIAGKDKEIQRFEQIVNNGVQIDVNKIQAEENEKAQQQLLHEEEKRMLKMQIQQQKHQIEQKEQINKQMREQLKTQNQQPEKPKQEKSQVKAVNFVVRQRENQQEASSEDFQEIFEEKYSDALKHMQQDSFKSNNTESQKDNI